MKQKDMYTLGELYANLDISLSKLSKIAGITEPTLTRIRDGYSARVETINKLLKAFADVYEIELSRENVTGIILEDKKAIRKQMLARKTLAKSTIEPLAPVPEQSTPSTAESPQKRTYKPRETDLPAGCILASEFAHSHDVKRPTFYAHMIEGLGTVQKEKVAYSERPKPGRPKEKERYLTSEQQHEALKFWQRHDVGFKTCNRFDCWCHTVLNQAKEKPIEEERPWYAPDGQ